MIYYNSFITQSISNAVNDIVDSVQGIWQILTELVGGIVDFIVFIPLMLRAGGLFSSYIVPQFYVVFAVLIVIFVIKILLGSNTK